MITSPFDRFTSKLEQNVYGSLKGALRLQLILDDLEDHYPAFNEKPLSILDVGGGNGYFAKICLEKNHRVLLVDASAEMLDKAETELATWKENKQLELSQMDFVVQDFSGDAAFDLVLMHGSAEWMSDPERAIIQACACLKPGGILSLLIFNKDKSTLKRGINGHLVGNARKSKKKKLIPPGAKTPAEIHALLEEKEGELLLQSGIRIFFGFFRQIDHDILTSQQWLEQERQYYRTPPFSSLGEHTHFIWQASF